MSKRPPIPAPRRDGSGRIIMDATEPLTITLAERDGKNAVRCDPGHCAFAEAAKREFPGVEEVLFTKTYTRLCWPEHIIRYRNSVAMREQIATFDATGTFTPGVYTLLPPAKSHRLGASETREKGRPKGKTTGERRPRVIGTGDLRPHKWSFGKTRPSRRAPAAKK